MVSGVCVCALVRFFFGGDVCNCCKELECVSGGGGSPFYNHQQFKRLFFFFFFGFALWLHLSQKKIPFSWQIRFFGV